MDFSFSGLTPMLLTEALAAWDGIGIYAKKNKRLLKIWDFGFFSSFFLYFKRIKTNLLVEGSCRKVAQNIFAEFKNIADFLFHVREEKKKKKGKERGKKTCKCNIAFAEISMTTKKYSFFSGISFIYRTFHVSQRDEKFHVNMTWHFHVLVFQLRRRNRWTEYLLGKILYLFRTFWSAARIATS